MLKPHLFWPLIISALFSTGAPAQADGLFNSCQSLLSLPAKDSQEFILPEKASAETLLMHQRYGARQVRQALVEFYERPASYDGFKRWSQEFLEADDLLIEIGLRESDDPEYVDPARALGEKQIDRIFSETMELFANFQYLRDKGYDQYPQLVADDGYAFSRFESWAMDLYGKATRLHRNYKHLGVLFSEKFLVFQETQNRIETLVRHLGNLVGARQQIFEHLTSQPSEDRISAALQSQVLPQIEVRLRQIKAALSERSEVAESLSEIILPQKEQMSHLSEILLQLDP